MGEQREVAKGAGEGVEEAARKGLAWVRVGGRVRHGHGNAKVPGPSRIWPGRAGPSRIWLKHVWRQWMRSIFGGLTLIISNTSSEEKKITIPSAMVAKTCSQPGCGLEARDESEVDLRAGWI